MFRWNPIIVIASTTVFICNILYAQPSPESRVFEAVTVKPSPLPGIRESAITAMRGGPGSVDPGRIEYRNIVLVNVFTQAYDVSHYQISGPGWLETSRFDITAKIPDGSTKEQFRIMLQNFLAERFGTSVRRESREMSGYALVVAKGATKLRIATNVAPSTETDQSIPPLPPLGQRKLDQDGFPLTPDSPGIHIAYAGGRCRLRGINATIGEVVHILAGHFDLPVVDETRLIEKYSFNLTYRLDRLTETQASQIDDGSAPDIFRALQKQLGLKLEQRKVVADIIIIDRIQKMPTEN